PGDRCDRPRAQLAGEGGAYEGVAEGPDHREHRVRARERDRPAGDYGVEVAGLVGGSGFGRGGRRLLAYCHGNLQRADFLGDAIEDAQAQHEFTWRQVELLVEL